MSDGYPRAVWRVIVHPAADGASNMAIDEAILENVAAGCAPATLRFFAWEPPCLSLGYGQPVSDVDSGRLAARGWGMVRRATGGRAILHTDELTYSVVAPIGEPRVEGGVVESYRRLSQGLLAGLQRLGVCADADRRAKSAAKPANPDCFEVPSDYEITANGRKLVGSAQTRRRGAVLQHGSLPLYGDLARICDVLVFPDEAAREAARKRVRRRAATLEEVLGERVEMARVVEAMTSGFATALNLDLQEDSLSPDEERRAEALRAEKYAALRWTAIH
jgi:lipoate-protein ligase A